MVTFCFHIQVRSTTHQFQSTIAPQTDNRQISIFQNKHRTHQRKTKRQVQLFLQKAPRPKEINEKINQKRESESSLQDQFNEMSTVYQI